MTTLSIKILTHIQTPTHLMFVTHTHGKTYREKQSEALEWMTIPCPLLQGFREGLESG